MFSDSSAPTAEVSADNLEQLRRTALCASQRADAVTYDWTLIGMGIVAAGGAYPTVVGAIAIGALMVSNILIGVDPIPGGRMEDGVEFVMWIVVGGGCGAMWSLIVAALTLPIIYLVMRTLALRTSIVRLGAFSGGSVGFICTLPLSVQIPWYSFPADVWELVLYALAGPGLATALGQIGGAWGGNKSRAAGPKILYWKRYSLEPAETTSTPSVEPIAVLDSTNTKFQFGIRQLLWVSAWLSLLLALIRLCGIPYELFLPLLTAWVLFQAGSIWIGERLARRLGPWWAQRRQPRST